MSINSLASAKTCPIRTPHTISCASAARGLCPSVVFEGRYVFNWLTNCATFIFTDFILLLVPNFSIGLITVETLQLIIQTFSGFVRQVFLPDHSVLSIA